MAKIVKNYWVFSLCCSLSRHFTHFYFLNFQTIPMSWGVTDEEMLIFCFYETRRPQSSLPFIYVCWSRRGPWLILGEVTRNSHNGKDCTGLELKSNWRWYRNRYEGEWEKNIAYRSHGPWVSDPIYAMAIQWLLRPPNTAVDEAPQRAGGALGAHCGPQRWAPSPGPHAVSPLSTLTTYPG